MLALFVVAALAMVSVAGAAMASEKADAKILTPVAVLTIDKDSTDWYGVYTETNTTATVKADAKYTGQVHFGSYDTYSKIFDSKVILEFTDVNNLIMSYDFEYMPDTVLITGDTAGNIKVLKGIAGAGGHVGTDILFFNGKISGNTATVDIANAYGFILKADAVDGVSGVVEQGSKQAVDKDGKPVFVSPGVPKLVPAVVKLEGNAVLFNFINTGGLTFNNARFIIAEGATLTGDGKARAYEIVDQQDIEITVDALSTGTPSGYAILFDSDGNPFTGGNYDTGVLTINTNANSIPLAGAYRLVMYYNEAVADAGVTTYHNYYYNGTLTFKPAFDTATGDLSDVSVNLSNSKTMPKLGSNAFIDAKATGFRYDPAIYKVFLFAVNGVPIGGNYIAEDGNVTVTLAGGENVFAIFQKKADKTMYVYSGTVTAGTGDARIFGASDSVDYLGVCKTVPTPQTRPMFVLDDSCKPASVNIADYAITTDQTLELALIDEAVMDVDGNLVMKYTTADSCATITTVSGSIINVKGLIEYQTISESAPLDYAKSNDTPPVYTGINAAHYFVAPAQNGTVYKHYYTTLDKAMPESSDIKIFGVLKVLKDTTLTGKSAESNKIAVQLDSMLFIGQVKTAKLESAVVIATVPKNTAFETEFGKASVINGQLKIEDEAEDRGDGIIADVFYVNAPYGIYTDLVTALENSKSGDTVTVRPVAGDVTIGRNAEVKEGVTLDATAMLDDKYLIVDSGVVFTLSGKMTVKGVMVMGSLTGDEPLDAGRLVLKSVELIVSADIELFGVLEFAPSFNNTADANKDKFDVRQIGIAGDEDAPAIIKIEGKLAYDIAKIVQKSMGIATVEFVIPGEAKFDADAFANLYTMLDVTGTVTFLKKEGPPAVTDVTFDEITATGKAKIVAATNGKAFVAEKAVFGAPANTLTQSINDVDATVYLKADALATSSDRRPRSL